MIRDNLDISNVGFIDSSMIAKIHISPQDRFMMQLALSIKIGK